MKCIKCGEIIPSGEHEFCSLPNGMRCIQCRSCAEKGEVHTIDEIDVFSMPNSARIVVSIGDLMEFYGIGFKNGLNRAEVGSDTKSIPATIKGEIV